MNNLEQTTFQTNYQRLNAEQKQAVDQIDGPVLVIAGPGTGKTQLLSLRIANILRQTDADPQNILAMTFTDAGAFNMRERLASFIGTDSYKVNIHTFHSFANEIIQSNREFFTDRNLENQASDLQKTEIINEILENSTQKLRSDEFKAGDALRLIGDLKKALISPDDLRQIVTTNIAEQDIFHQKIKGLMLKPHAKFPELLEFILEIRQKMLETLQSSPAKLSKTPSNLQIYFDALETAIAEGEGASSTKPINAWRKAYLNKKNRGGDFEITDVFTNKRLANFVEIYAKFQDKMKEENLYDFDDMILEVIRALETHDDLRYTLQEKYQYILLDEYQDTNEAQARIVELLTNNPVNEGKPNVLAVGDDDQAIMAFQGANKSNMIDFFNRFDPRDITLVNLTKNYRSHGDILTAAKNVAKTIEGRLTKNLPIKIEKNISAEGDFEGKPVKILRQNFASQVAEFAWVADKITELIKAGTNPSEIAILAPRHKLLEAIMPYLKRQNLPIWYERRENILENEIVHQLISIAKLTLAIRDKNDEQMNSVFPEVLSYPFWQIPAVEAWQLSWRAHDQREYWIEAILSSDCPQIAKMGQILVNLAEQSFNKTFEEMFDLMLGSQPLQEASNDTEGLKSPIRDFLSQKSDGEFFEAMSVLTVLRDNLREYAKNQQNDLDIFAKFVESYTNANLQIINTNPHKTNAHAVQVMTAFKAKGLEFEHVFLLSANQEGWNNNRGSNGGTLIPQNLKFIRPTDEGADTRKRLFFVAITRTKTNLYLTSFLQNFNGKKTKPLEFLDEREEDKILKAKILPEQWQNVAEGQADAVKIEDIQANWHDYYLAKNETMRELLRPKIEKYRLSVTDLNNFIDTTYGGPQKFYESKFLHFPEGYSPKSTFGNLVHSGFEFIQNRINQGEKPQMSEMIQQMARDMEKYTLKDSDKSEFLERFEVIFGDFLANRLGEFHAGDAPEKNFASVGVTVGDAVLNGKIDLVKIDRENKKITVLDYKTGSIPLTPNSQINAKSSKIYKYTQQLYFYKILIEGAPEFAGYTVEKGVLEFVEPSHKNGQTYTYEVDFNPEYEAFLKKLIQAVWAKIKAFDFTQLKEYPGSTKGIQDFENDLIAEFEENLGEK